MQAKDIPDEVFIAAVQACSRTQAKQWGQRDAWCNTWTLLPELEARMGHPVPLKVVLAKAERMIRRKRMDGCTCGCRGDFDLRGYPDDPFRKTQENR